MNQKGMVMIIAVCMIMINYVPNLQGKNIPRHFVDTSNRYTLEEIENDIHYALKNYNDITELINIGNSYEDRPLYVLKIGTKKENTKPSVFFISNIHGREDFSSMLTMKMMDYLLYYYYLDESKWGNYNIKEILDNVDMYFLFVGNPDGLNIAHNGIKASKNYEFLKGIPNIAKDDRWWKANARGVDLNRNFNDGNWSRISSSWARNYPASDMYKGDGPDSELETQAIQKFCEEIKPLMAVSYHTTGNLFYWADEDTHKYFNGIDRDIIKRMAKLTGYSITEVKTDVNTYACGFENWFRSRFHRFGFVIELAKPVGQKYAQHPDEDFDVLVWENAKYTAIHVAQEALNYYNTYYDIYQSDQFLCTMYDKDKAIQYAQKLNNTMVINNNEIIFSNSACHK